MLASCSMRFFQALAILHDLLAFFGLVPEVGLGDLLLRVWLVRFACAGASKIAPHGVGLLAERRVFAFEFVEGHGS